MTSFLFNSFIYTNFKTSLHSFDPFRNLYPRQSELIRYNSKKNFNLDWSKSVKNQSFSIRVNTRFVILIKIQSDLIRLDTRLLIRKKFLLRINPGSEWFKLDSHPNNSDLGFIRIQKLSEIIRILSFGLTRIKSHRFSTDLHQKKLKFNPNQSDLFRHLYQRQSEKNFNLLWCKSVENLCDLIRNWESEWFRTIFES